MIFSFAFHPLLKTKQRANLVVNLHLQLAKLTVKKEILKPDLQQQLTLKKPSKILGLAKSFDLDCTYCEVVFQIDRIADLLSSHSSASAVRLVEQI
jgi:hypothetical protein